MIYIDFNKEKKLTISFKKILILKIFMYLQKILLMKGGFLQHKRLNIKDTISKKVKNNHFLNNKISEIFAIFLIL